jgi:hypothetical protein
MIYHTQGKQANRYTTDVVPILFTINRPWEEYLQFILAIHSYATYESDAFFSG